MISDAGKASDASALVLCLSGGGFRATFYHLGVVRLLAKTGLLTKVNHVFSVSGGSILAAHMALNWESYTSPDDSEFHRVADELIRFGRSDVRGRILRRWIPFLMGRTPLFQRSLNVLYKDKKLRELPEVPRFHFLATSLTSGQLCAFDKDQWIAISAKGGGPNFAGVNAGYLELAKVVAASAAFPPMFPPVRIRATGFDQQEARFQATHYLTDGGIFDNLGMAEVFHVINNIGLGAEPPSHPIMKAGFTTLQESLEMPSCVIVSDASASFDEAKTGGFASIVSRTSRATDILMARLAERDIDVLGHEMRHWKDQDRQLIHLSIKRTAPSFDLKSGFQYETQSATIQHGIRYVRTDLDRFDPKLIGYLIRHGYDVAAHAVRYIAPDAEIDALKPDAYFTASFGAEDEEQLERFLKSQKARFRKDNLFGLLSMPFGIVVTLAMLAIAFNVAYSVFQ